MSSTQVTGFLHPGQMGSALAAACSGERLWAGDGRSPATAARARQAQLTDVGTLDSRVARSDTIVSICPPAAAVDMARAVADRGFEGTYVDANAVAPHTSREIADLFDHFVDGGVIGPPPQSAGTTRMYLSGTGAAVAAERWQGSVLEVRVVDGPAGAASAVKMCFAAWTKGTAALLLSIRALAEAEGVARDIVGEWETSMPHLLAQAEGAASGVAPKAWRFAGEMDEIAATFGANGLPDGFHLAAAEVYRRLAPFKDQPADEPLRSVIDALLER